MGAAGDGEADDVDTRHHSSQAETRRDGRRLGTGRRTSRDHLRSQKMGSRGTRDHARARKMGSHRTCDHARLQTMGSYRNRTGIVRDM